MADRFEDKRGVIQDLLGAVDGVTWIRTVKDAVRGNHVHRKTTQWVFVVSGVMVVAEAGCKERLVFPGDFFEEKPGVPHAWRAITGCEVLVFTKGPRSGEAYESDTERLAYEDWLLDPAHEVCGACHQSIRPGDAVVTSGGQSCHQICPQSGTS